MAEILEMIMVVLFGISWPLNIIKAIKSKSAKGTSMWFLICIILGYLSGIFSKIIANHITYVFVFYIINLLMVLATLVIYFINKNHDKKNNEICK